MVKSVVGILILLTALGFGAYMLVDWAWETDIKNANAYCEQFDAKPNYTYRTRYFCVAPDGRVVG